MEINSKVHLRVWECSAGSEVKLVLWWFKMIELCLRQIDFGAEHRRVVKVLLAVIPALSSLGEDKSTAGLLGAIGFGRKSALSHRWRHTCHMTRVTAHLSHRWQHTCHTGDITPVIQVMSHLSHRCDITSVTQVMSHLYMGDVTPVTWVMSHLWHGWQHTCDVTRVTWVMINAGLIYTVSTKKRPLSMFKNLKN